MKSTALRSLLSLSLWMAGAAMAGADGLARDHTCFQTASPYMPALDIGSDVAVVYGVNGSFADRVAQWRAQGYTVGMMTGIAWGGYGDYYMTDEGFRKEEVQTGKSGQLRMHGHSTTVGYNVPTDAYVAYIKKIVEPAVDLGVQAVYLEEPEYWAETGWSEGFKRAWQAHYGIPWEAPDSSVDAQYKASRLKYELYFNALRDVVRHIKARARAQGKTVECHVPTHSLINYAQWRIVSPEAHLMDLEEMDGYIAQVWTGTARTPNMYRGLRKSRTFETAYLEYGQALGMVRPTGRKVWFLADPIEDNPDRSWNDYRLNYECTVAASLLWPEVHRFEVMPWPNRIFRGSYPKVDLDTKSGEREGIPADYATEILAVINALNDMDQADVVYDTGTRGIGILVSDSLMFQRAQPHPSDPGLGSFYALALPLVKHGIPVEIAQLENSLCPGALDRYTVLLLTYEGQKPLKAAYHEALAAWVRQGGCLLYVGDGTDPYHNVKEWWNKQGENQAKAHEDLFERLGLDRPAYNEALAVGAGYVRVFDEKPRALQRYEYGAEKVIALVAELLEARGETLATQNYLSIRRGPYLIASVLDESPSETPLMIEGNYVDLFDPLLRPLSKRELQAGERALLCDLAWLRENRGPATVAAAAARIGGETLSEGLLRFTARGPAMTTARLCVLLPGPPERVRSTPEAEISQSWDEKSGTLALRFENLGKPITLEVAF